MLRSRMVRPSDGGGDVAVVVRLPELVADGGKSPVVCRCRRFGRPTGRV